MFGPDLIPSVNIIRMDEEFDTPVAPVTAVARWIGLKLESDFGFLELR
jgi:hypothetical protein